MRALEAMERKGRLMLVRCAQLRREDGWYVGCAELAREEAVVLRGMARLARLRGAHTEDAEGTEN